MFHEWIIHLNLGLHFLSVESKELKIEFGTMKSTAALSW